MPDILIRGMKMPENCIDCPCMVDKYGGDNCCLQSEEANEKIESWDDMKAGCPLHELPEHGDLISRDEAVSVLQNIGSRDYRREKGTICDAIKMISHSQYVPTIVPASEEWKK